MREINRLIESARPLAELGRTPGSPGFQWREPGRNAVPVVAQGSAALTGAAGSANVLVYDVPEGMVFVLTGVLLQFMGTGWNQGGSDLIISITVAGSAAARTVQYFGDVRTQIGSLDNGPYRFPCSYRFLQQSRLTVRFTESGVIPGGDTQNFIAHLVGYEVPESELPV